MQNAIERWKELLDARALQMDAAYARLGRTSADFWDRRASGFYRATRNTATSDPLFQLVSQVVTPDMSVLDVGAGTGRFTLSLASQAKHITAVEPNASMLDFLRQDASTQGLTNISYIPMTWQDAPNDLSADVIICSHVLYPIRDIDAFLTKLRAATRRICYIYLRAIHFDALTSHIWQHFHGEERVLSPAYIHALDVMYDMGIYASVSIVDTPQTMRYSSLEVAVDEIQEQLILPGDEQTRAELRKILQAWLVERNGFLTLPLDKLTCGIIQMTP